MSNDPTSPARVVMRFPTKVTLSLPGNWSWILMSPWTTTIGHSVLFQPLGSITATSLNHDILQSSISKNNDWKSSSSLSCPQWGGFYPQKIIKGKIKKDLKLETCSFGCRSPCAESPRYHSTYQSKSHLRNYKLTPCYHSLLMRKTTSANTSTLPLCYKLPFFSCFFSTA